MLYKYRNFQGLGKEFIRTILVDYKLWGSKAANLNDEFDCSPIVYAPTNPSDIFKRSLELRSSEVKHFAVLGYEKLEVHSVGMQESLDFAVGDVRQEIAVLSLSLRPDSRKLWDEYSDSFKGVCLGFSSGGKGNILRKARLVKYVDQWPDLKLPQQQSKAQMNRVLTLKTRMWEEEKEARLIGQSEGPIQYPKGALRAVIFGEDCHSEDKNDVLKWLAEGLHANVSLYIASRSDAGVKVRPVSD